MRSSDVMRSLLLGCTVISFIACGPSPRQRPTGDDDGNQPDATEMPCQVAAEGDLATCSDGIGGHSCTTDADCAAVQPGPQRCFDIITSPQHECRQTYTSTLDFVGFGQGQTFADPSNIVKVCVNMEHSWMRDIQIDLVAPDGKTVHLQKFEGQTGGEVYLGDANDNDDSANPVPGVRGDYCWTPTATNAPDIDYANAGGMMLSYNGHSELPPGDYQASDPWTNLVGAPLNGSWSLVITDLWGIDNGYLFSWSITFDANLVADCGGPIVGRTGPQQ